MIEDHAIDNRAPGHNALSSQSGGAAEFGTRYHNWRELWGTVSQPHADGISDVELLHCILCLVAPDYEDNGKIATLLIEKYGNFVRAIAAPLADRDYLQGFPVAAGVALKVIHAAAKRLAESETTNQTSSCWPDGP